MIEWFKQLFLGFPLTCKHKWSMPKQFVVDGRAFIGHRCKLCGKVE